jgi:hypothetical protein
VPISSRRRYRQPQHSIPRSARKEKRAGHPHRSGVAGRDERGLATEGPRERGGPRRAAARGEHIGYRPDGYRLAVNVDPNGQISKRLVFDSDRQPLIELIFGLALRGKRSGAIARAVTEAGWRTKPAQRGCVPRLFTVDPN